MSKYRTKNIDRTAEVLKALGHPNRLRIFSRLVGCCEKGVTYDSCNGLCPCVGELGKDLDIAASTLSHHVNELRRAGLIHMERKGQKIECWVDKKVLEDISGFFAELNN
ncbi:MAG: helix-turn-helix transcriptional regulator [Planctomycetes bacterium]|nr:helix-turn-helix transcriptional regulator [Planctomycetota bacterium]